METHEAQIPDSPSKNSYIGSYYQPPGRITPMPGHLELSAHSLPRDPQPRSPQPSSSKSSVHSRAVINALKNLQRKINQMELERKQAETNYQQLSQDGTSGQQVSSPYVDPGLPTANQPGPGRCNREEYTLKLQSVEARCKILEKQLNYMRRMVENSNKERRTVIEKQSLLQNLQPDSSDMKSQHEKLERLENKYFKLSRTQALTETKLAILEDKLLKEECERLLVQEKADQAQKELDANLHFPASVAKEEKKTQTPKRTKESPPQCQVALPFGLKHKKMPFVAGKSTSPSHSVHANVQSILHMMKHHQPWLCEQVSALHRPEGGVRKTPDKEFSPKPARELKQADRSLGSLSDLLLALQDELGQMSFEHQDLLGQLDLAHHRKEREDLKLELESLVTRMEEKGAQITKLRKHWQVVQNLTQGQRGHEGQVSRKNAMRPPALSPVNLKHKGKKEGTIQNNLQLLRETQKFRYNLKEDDIYWEM